MAVKKKTPIFNVYGNDYKTFDGTCIRDYIHVCDLAEIHFKILLKINSDNKSIVPQLGTTIVDDGALTGSSSDYNTIKDNIVYKQNR